MDRARRYRLIVVLALGPLTGCLHPGQPLVAERSPVFTPAPDSTPAASGAPAARPAPRPGSYLVRQGDTLYSIAWRFEMDHAALARANGIARPYTIYPGQRLLLRAAPPAARPAPVTPSRPAPVRPQPPARWVWPVNARPVREFGRASKGLDFEFGSGAATSIHAVNHGQVVYAGSGIGGYERLIIIKHVDSLLSAYSFNGAIRVTEQQQVKAGEEVADIRDTGRTSQKLHFELRKDGDPVDPRSVLD